MKKILAMLGALSLVISSSATVIACGNDASINVEKILEKINLQTNLGQFETKPSNEDIYNRIKELNPNIELNQIEIIESTTNQVKIKVITASTVYKQETFTLTYSLKNWINLNQVVTKTQLGEFEKKPENSDILHRVWLMNNDLDVEHIELINHQENQATISVVPNSTLYLPGTIQLTYYLKEWSNLKDDLKTTQLGLFETKPTTDDLLTRIQEVNPTLFASELTFTIDDKMTNEATVSVKPNSSIYHQDSTTIYFDINYSEIITDSFIDRAKSLVIAENFGLNHQKTYDIVKEKDSQSATVGYDNFFEDNSIDQSETNANLKGSLGELGGILGLFLDHNLDFNIPSEIEGILNSLTNENVVLSDLPFEQITQLMNLAFNFLGSVQVADLVAFLPLLSLITLPDDIIETIKSGYEEFVETSLNEEVIQSILEALQKGTDLSRFIQNPNLSINDLYSGLIFSFINTLGYGIEQEGYQKINLLEAMQASGEGKYNSALNNFDKWINEGKIESFQFNETNASFILENLLLTVSILNHVLTFYRTSDIDYSAILANNQDPSQYLFSTKTPNDLYMSNLTKTKINQIAHDWKTFNLGEMIANLKYYLGSGPHQKYRLQKLVYIMLVNGDELSPLATFIKVYLIKTLGIGGIPFADSVLRELFHDDIFYPLANNKELKLRDFWTGLGNSLRWAGISLLIDSQLGSGMGSVIKQLLADIQWYLGSRSFDGLYHKDLLTVLGYLVNRGLPGEADIAALINTLKQAFGSNEVKSLEVLLNQVKLNDLITLAGVGITKNKNQPTHGSYYLDQTIVGLIDDISAAFNITGLETSNTLKKHYLDFNLIGSLGMDLFFPTNNQDTGLIGEIINSLEDLNHVFYLLGIVNIDNNTAQITSESFLGKVIQLLFPELEVKQIIDTSELVGLYNQGQWLLKGIQTLLNPLLAKEEIDSFVSTIWRTDNVFKTDVEKEYFEDVKLVKSITTIIEFDPNKVVFQDRSQLSGEKVKYQITASRDKKHDKFIYKNITKI